MSTYYAFAAVYCLLLPNGQPAGPCVQNKATVDNCVTHNQKLKESIPPGFKPMLLQCIKMGVPDKAPYIGKLPDKST